MNEAKRIAMYRYNYIDTLEEFKKTYEREKENNNINECYYVVKYYNNDMQQFNNLNDCINYIREDYNNTKDEYFTELNGYTISLVLYTKPINYKGVEYEYNYNMEELKELI